MRTNRKIVTNTLASDTWRTWAVVSTCLLTAACGGNNEHSRPTGDSDVILKGTALEGCDSENALAKYDLIAEGNFTPWKFSRDSSPKPAGSARPVYDCPADSSFDCCSYEGVSNDWPADQSGLDANTLAQIALEKELQKDYRCQSLGGLNSSSGLLGGLDLDPIDTPIRCKKELSPAEAPHIRVARLSDWGAEIYYEYKDRNNPNNTEYGEDMSEYDGVAFWVRGGQGGTQPVGKTLFFAVTDRFTKENQDKYQLVTDPETGLPVLTENAKGDPIPQYELNETGKAIPVVAANRSQALNCYDVATDAEKCDRFGHGVGLTDEWRFVKIPFVNMRQRGFGVKSPAGRPLREELKGISFYLDIGNWDFWIYGIGFYKDPASEK